MGSVMTMTLVRWSYSGGKGKNPDAPNMTLWHIDAPIPADDEGRTACGRRYPRRHAEMPEGDIGEEPVCMSCLAAYGGSYPESGDEDVQDLLAPVDS